MKLEIGAGKSPTPGYAHLDIEAGPDIEIVREAWYTGLEDNSVEEVYARHVLEHFSCADAELALKEWMRILQQGGRVHLIVPNLEFHASQLTMPGNSSFFAGGGISNRQHALCSIYGWNGDAMAHKWGYVPATLTRLLNLTGFERIFIDLVDGRECDIDMEAFKP